MSENKEADILDETNETKEEDPIDIPDIVCPEPTDDIYNKYIQNNIPLFTMVRGIKIYDNTTVISRQESIFTTKYLRSKIVDKEKLFSPLTPSIATAQGQLTNVSFREMDLILILKKPTGLIQKIGCNYGELFNDNYVPPPVKEVKTNRGRKKKEKAVSRRQKQGNGRYFSSQITFVIQHPQDTKKVYKIKLFRNGVFQVPGVTNPEILDLIDPIFILHSYIKDYFPGDIQIKYFMAVMRNYKARLLNKNYHINLEKLEEIITNEKFNSGVQKTNEMVIKKLGFIGERLRNYIKPSNPMYIAEIVYNTDRCFSLNIKFRRPMVLTTKETTVKLLKKGKINFDSCKSQLEAEELYAWLEYIYNKYHDDILCDILTITNDTDDSDDDDLESLYDDDE